MFLFLLPGHPWQGVRVLIFLHMDPVAFLFFSENGESAFFFRVLNRYASLVEEVALKSSTSHNTAFLDHAIPLKTRDGMGQICLNHCLF